MFGPRDDQSARARRRQRKSGRVLAAQAPDPRIFRAQPLFRQRLVAFNSTMQWLLTTDTHAPVIVQPMRGSTLSATASRSTPQSFRASTKRIETSAEAGSPRQSSCKAKPVSCHPASVDAQEPAWPSMRPSRRADTKQAIGKEPSDELRPPAQRLPDFLQPAHNARPEPVTPQGSSVPVCCVVHPA